MVKNQASQRRIVSRGKLGRKATTEQLNEQFPTSNQRELGHDNENRTTTQDQLLN